MKNKDVFQNVVMYENCSIIQAKEENGNYVIHAVAQQIVLGEKIFTPIYIIVDKSQLQYLPKTKEMYTVAGPFHSNPNMGVFFTNPSISKNTESSYNNSKLSTGTCIISQNSVDKFYFSDQAYFNTLGVLIYHKNLVLNVDKIGYSNKTQAMAKQGGIKQTEMPPLDLQSPNSSTGNVAPNNAPVNNGQGVNGNNNIKGNNPNYINNAQQNYATAPNRNVNNQYQNNRQQYVGNKNVNNNNFNQNSNYNPVNNNSVKSEINSENTLGINDKGQQISYDEIILDESTVRNLVNIL